MRTARNRHVLQGNLTHWKWPDHFSVYCCVDTSWTLIPHMTAAWYIPRPVPLGSVCFTLSPCCLWPFAVHGPLLFFTVCESQDLTICEDFAILHKLVGSSKACRLQTPYFYSATTSRFLFREPVWKLTVKSHWSLIIYASVCVHLKVCSICLRMKWRSFNLHRNS